MARERPRGLTGGRRWASLVPVSRAKLLTLKEMTEASGRTPRTVRYYEHQGLLRARRSAGGHRLFAPEEVDRLDLIVSLREAGASLEEIAALLRAREEASDPPARLARLAAHIDAQISRLDRRLEKLARLRADLVATRELLPVCRECVRGPAEPVCETCEEIPAQGAPRTLRVAWCGRSGGHAGAVGAAEGEGEP